MLLAVAAPASAAGVGLNVGTDGTVAISLSVVDANGSSLRYAMDGNFSPLIDSLPVNATEKASILASISGAESSPLLAGLFGNRDGTVEASEVANFEGLLRDEASAIPSGALTGGNILSLTLNGVAPGSAMFVAVTFQGAPGPDTSTASITLVSQTQDSFLPEGTSGTLVAAWNFTIAGSIALPAPNATVSVTTPAGTSIASATGLLQESVQNDWLGYGSATATGSVGPSSTGSATVVFHPSFPTGDVLIGGAIAAAVALGIIIALLRRRRRQRRADDAPRD